MRHFKIVSVQIPDDHSKSVNSIQCTNFDEIVKLILMEINDFEK